MRRISQPQRLYLQTAARLSRALTKKRRRGRETDTSALQTQKMQQAFLRPNSCSTFTLSPTNGSQLNPPALMKMYWVLGCPGDPAEFPGGRCRSDGSHSAVSRAWGTVGGQEDTSLIWLFVVRPQLGNPGEGGIYIHATLKNNLQGFYNILGSEQQFLSVFLKSNILVSGFPKV